jgi:hypothetical protein
MCGSGVLVHGLSRLGAAVAVRATEFLFSDRMLAQWTLKRGKAVQGCDGVISHNFNCSHLSRSDSERKLPWLPGLTQEFYSRASQALLTSYLR